MTDQIFFAELLDKTEIAFRESPIYLKNKDKNWYYSICATPLHKGAVLILGINWGADKDGHEPQRKIPSSKEFEEYGFIKRSSELLERHVFKGDKLSDYNYANLCFFRSPREKDLVFEDYQKSFPLFNEYVEYIDPTAIISLSVMNVSKLKGLNKIENLKEFPDERNKYRGYKGTVLGKRFYAVPHPNARVPKESREQIWDSLFV